MQSCYAKLTKNLCSYKIVKNGRRRKCMSVYEAVRVYKERKSEISTKFNLSVLLQVMGTSETLKTKTT